MLTVLMKSLALYLLVKTFTTYLTFGIDFHYFLSNYLTIILTG